MDGKRILQNFPSGVVVMFLLLRLPSVFQTTKTQVRTGLQESLLTNLGKAGGTSVRQEDDPLHPTVGLSQETEQTSLQTRSVSSVIS